MPGFKRPPRGHVSLARICDRLHVDRRVLKRLYEGGELAGVRAGGVIWLERRSLAEYLWSRPRCIRADCTRRVIGDGPGCAHHWRDGRRRRPTPACPSCGDPFAGRGRECRRCATRRANVQRGPGVEGLQEGNHRYRTDVARVKAERALLNVDELLGRLRGAGVLRSPGAIAGHVRTGLLEAEQDIGFAKPQLFSEASIDAYLSRLQRHPDGRLTRFNDPKRLGEWIKRRHGMAAARRAWGRANAALSEARGTRVGRPRGRNLDRKQIAVIRDMSRRGKTPGAIAIKVGISRTTVRRVLGL